MVWYGAFSSTVPTSFIYSFIHSPTQLFRFPMGTTSRDAVTARRDGIGGGGV